jgi:hypothetical protein
LLGGPLNAAGSSTTATTSVASSSSSSNFPGILALRSQGQGWGQIAKSTNVQLGQVISSARTAFKSSSTSSDTSLSPTGRTSAEINAGRASGTDTGSSTAHPSDRGQGKAKAWGKDDDTHPGRGSKDKEDKNDASDASDSTTSSSRPNASSSSGASSNSKSPDR